MNHATVKIFQNETLYFWASHFTIIASVWHAIVIKWITLKVGATFKQISHLSIETKIFCAALEKGNVFIVSNSATPTKSIDAYSFN